MMRKFSEFITENNAGLYGFFDDVTKTLRITRPNGSVFNIKSPELAHVKIFGVQTVNDQIVVLTGPLQNPQPIKKIVFSSSGIYQGSYNIW